MSVLEHQRELELLCGLSEVVAESSAEMLLHWCV